MMPLRLSKGDLRLVVEDVQDPDLHISLQRIEGASGSLFPAHDLPAIYYVPGNLKHDFRRTKKKRVSSVYDPADTV